MITDEPATLRSDELVRLRRRTLTLLIVGQVLGGLGLGASLSVGALAASDLAGEAWSGIAATVNTLGAALFALPLARLADRRGRRVSLSSAALIAAGGSAVCVLGLSVASVVLLFLGLGLVGAATAGALQSRFAATDLASAGTRGRDLSLVVWSTTIGAVTGPNLAEPGSALGAAFGLPPLSGVFLFPLVAQLIAAAAYLVGMRPDPLLTSRRLLAITTRGPSGRAAPPPPTESMTLVRVAIATLALSHATMVALMSMTPVHLVHGGATLSVVGFTISLHIAGMFALSPVFGVLADRFGRVPDDPAGSGDAVSVGRHHRHRRPRDGHRHAGTYAARPRLERLDGGRGSPAGRGGTARSTSPSAGPERSGDEPRRCRRRCRFGSTACVARVRRVGLDPSAAGRRGGRRRGLRYPSRATRNHCCLALAALSAGPASRCSAPRSALRILAVPGVLLPGV